MPVRLLFHLLPNPHCTSVVVITNLSFTERAAVFSDTDLSTTGELSS